MNKGLKLLSMEIEQLCREIAGREGFKLDGPIIDKEIMYANRWKCLRFSLLNARLVTGHDRYMRWYKDSFKGKKRPRSDSSYLPSEPETSSPVEPKIKRPAY